MFMHLTIQSQNTAMINKTPKTNRNKQKNTHSYKHWQLNINKV